MHITSLTLAAAREPVTPPMLIIMGGIGLAIGTIGAMTHTRGHGVSRTAASPLLMACFGAVILLAGIVWAMV